MSACFRSHQTSQINREMGDIMESGPIECSRMDAATSEAEKKLDFDIGDRNTSRETATTECQASNHGVYLPAWPAQLLIFAQTACLLSYVVGVLSGWLVAVSTR